MYKNMAQLWEPRWPRHTRTSSWEGLINKPCEGAKTKPYVWWRYLDDIFMIWTGNEDELREFIEYLNNLHP